MNWKLSMFFALLAACVLSPLAGCQPAEKMAPAEPPASTTDSP